MRRNLRKKSTFKYGNSTTIVEFIKFYFCFYNYLRVPSLKVICYLTELKWDHSLRRFFNTLVNITQTTFQNHWKLCLLWISFKMSPVLRVYFRVTKIINQCPTTYVHPLNQSYTWISCLRSEHKICTTDKLNSKNKSFKKIFYAPTYPDSNKYNLEALTDFMEEENEFWTRSLQFSTSWFNCQHRLSMRLQIHYHAWLLHFLLLSKSLVSFDHGMRQFVPFACSFWNIHPEI